MFDLVRWYLGRGVTPRRESRRTGGHARLLRTAGLSLLLPLPLVLKLAGCADAYAIGSAEQPTREWPDPYPTLPPGAFQQILADTTIVGDVVVPDGETWLVGRRVEIAGNLRTVGGTIAMRPGSSLKFLGANPDEYVGGGLTYSDQYSRDIGLWIGPAGALDIQDYFDRVEWLNQAANPVAFAPYLVRAPLGGGAARPVLYQWAVGDRTEPNPTTESLLRGGDLFRLSSLYRHDQVAAGLPERFRANPHGFLTWTFFPDVADIARAAQEQAAQFLLSDGQAIDRVDPRFELAPSRP